MRPGPVIVPTGKSLVGASAERSAVLSEFVVRHGEDAVEIHRPQIDHAHLSLGIGHPAVGDDFGAFKTQIVTNGGGANFLS